MPSSFVVERGKTFCRGCNSEDLFSALDLGNLPIANELWSSPAEPVERFPLHLRICRTCGLGQVEDVVTPERLFRDYRYLSSISTGFVEHARIFAVETAQRLKLSPADLVVEIASNDGYLLNHFLDLGIAVLGIEPAENVALLAIQKGVPTVSEFFGETLARSLVDSYPTPKLIVANNVMAHVPDLQDFISGLAVLAGPETFISIENPSLMNFIESDQFDTIYHEHYSYLTSHSVAQIAANVGLRLIEVERIPTHGGSNRYWLQKISDAEGLKKSVLQEIEGELSSGLFDLDAWGAFSSRANSTLTSFRDWLYETYKRGENVYGYGAAAKASTLINAAGIDTDWITGIADGSHEKQGRFMPINGIPIVSPETLFAASPDHVIIFPWNIKEELVKIIARGSTKRIQIWNAIPIMTKIF
ncbi:MAG: class I SAM-dependent methyltransferase [Actinomycetes bacterium]